MTELSDGAVALYTESLPAEVRGGDEEEEGYAFYLESTGFHEVDFTIDFAGSSNFFLMPLGGGGATPTPAPANKGSLAASVTARPYERKPLARLLMVDPYDDASMTYSMRWKVRQPDAKAVAARASDEREETMRRLAAAEVQWQQYEWTVLRTSRPTGGGPRGVPSALLPLEEVRKVLRSGAGGGGDSYIDLGFPPVMDSIDAEPPPRSTTPAGASGGDGVVEAAASTSLRFSWRRPADFLSGHQPSVFVDGLLAADVQQGQLGNCYFMCSVAALCEFPSLVRSLFLHEWPDGSGSGPTHEADGMYDLQFCKHGQWCHVRIDDYIPCRPGGGGPVFSQANGPELWVLLVEKAYAKLHGSYYSLRSGYCFEALMDLTGAPTLYRRFDEDVVSFADLARYGQEPATSAVAISSQCSSPAAAAPRPLLDGTPSIAPRHCGMTSVA